MACWIVCRACGAKELVQSGTDHWAKCPQCSAERLHWAMYEGDKGEAMICWSADSDPTSWET